MTYTLDQVRKIPLFFIVGKGRSGTTLLSTILDSHPHVASATESRFLLVLWQRYKNLKKWTPEMADEFIQNIKLDLHVKKLWDFEEDFSDALKSLPQETKAADLIKMVYLFRKSNFPKKEIKFIVDKNPMYTLFVDRIKSIFPEAKFYRLVRDPRDNITSHLRNYNLHCGILAYKWLRFNQLLDQFAAKHPNDFYTQRYEDLILDKSTYFSDFEKYTGIDSLNELEEKRLQYKDQFESKFDERLKDQHQASVKPLDPKKIGHFKSKLSSSQLAVIESICFPYASSFQYESTVESINISLINKLRWKGRHLFLNGMNLFLYTLPFSIMKVLSHYFDKAPNSSK